MFSGSRYDSSDEITLNDDGDDDGDDDGCMRAAYPVNRSRCDGNGRGNAGKLDVEAEKRELQLNNKRHSFA